MRTSPAWRGAWRGLGATTALAVSTLLVALLLIGTSASGALADPSAGPTVSPLASSNYAVAPVCGRPTLGARCLALELVPVSAAARERRHPIGMSVKARAAVPGAAEACTEHPITEGCYGLRPADLQAAYSLATMSAPTPQTVAIVAAFDDPTAVKDLKRYDETFGLPACNTHDKCLQQVNQKGEKSPLPTTEGIWAQEISIDIEATHAVCQNCHILLVEAEEDTTADLDAAEDTAAADGANEISNSWVQPEPSSDSAAFDHPGVVITAGSGDEGYLNWVPGSPEAGHIGYPASSPHVVAVGGTRLEEVEGRWTSSIWNGFGIEHEKGATGGGCSEHFEAPYWQRELPDWAGVGCEGRRAVADISAVGDPFTGMAIYDSTPLEAGGSHPGWQTLGGTSLASPVIAAMFALAGGDHANGAGEVEYPARTLYENAALNGASVHDIESGSNGSCLHRAVEEDGLEPCMPGEEAAICLERAICLAGHGYDGPSGVGTPDGIGDFQATGKAAKKPQQLHFTSAAPSAARVAGTPYTATATSSSGLLPSFASATPSTCVAEGAKVSFSAVGTCTIEALQTGDGEYQAAAPVQQSFTVAPASQTVSFTSTAPTSAVAGGAPYAVSALSTSGLPVTFSSLTPAVCSAEAATVSFIAAGTCTIAAAQAGNGDYEAAAEVMQSFSVAPAAALGPGLTNLVKGPSGETISFKSGGPDSDFTFAGNPVVNHRTGAITFSLSLVDPGSISWRLTFGPGGTAARRALSGGCHKGEIRLGRGCHALPAVFAAGHLTTTRSGKVSFTVTPGQLGRAALMAATGAARGILVGAEVRVQSAMGGRPSSQKRALADYLTAAKRG